MPKVRVYTFLGLKILGSANTHPKKIISEIYFFLIFNQKKRPDETPWKEEVQTEICVFESENNVKFFPLETFPIDFVKKCAKGILKFLHLKGHIKMT